MKEFHELRTTLNETAEDLVEHMLMPPQVLVLRRITVRQFPGDTMVALYKNDRLGLTFSIPYGSDIKPVLTPVHEETEQLDEISLQLAHDVYDGRTARWLKSQRQSVSGPRRAEARDQANKEFDKAEKVSDYIQKKHRANMLGKPMFAKEESEQLDEISIPTATRAFHARDKRGIDALVNKDYKAATFHFKKSVKTLDRRAVKYGREAAGQTVKEGYPTKKHQDAKRASWMGTFEDHVTQTEPRHAGKIEWDTAHHFYNQGHDAQAAARRYVNSKSDSLPSRHDPDGIERNAWGKLHESHDSVATLRGIRDGHAMEHVKHHDGAKTRVDHVTAHALLTVHDALSPDNQKKMSDAMSHSKQKFHRIVDFAWKNVK